MYDTLGAAYLVAPLPIDRRAPNWEDEYYLTHEPKRIGVLPRIVGVVILGLAGLAVGALHLWV